MPDLQQNPLIVAITTAFEQYVKDVVRSTVQETPLPDAVVLSPEAREQVKDVIDHYDITDHRHFRNAVHEAMSDYESDELSYGQRNEVEGMIDDAKNNCATDDHEHDELSDSQRDEVDEIARKVFKQNVDSHNHCELSADQVVQVEQIVDRMQRDVPVHYLVKMEDLAAKAALGAIDPYFVYNEVHENEHVRNEIVSLVSAVPRLTPTEFTQMLLAALDEAAVHQRLRDFINNNCTFVVNVEKV